MKTRVFQVLIALAMCLALAGSAYAAQGKGGGKGKSKDATTATDKKPPKNEKAKAANAQGKSDKKQTAHNDVGPDDRPHGWDQGGKKGWGDCDVPPGLAKKRGCDSTGYSSRERIEVARQRRVAAQRTTTTTTKKTTTTTTTTQKKSDGGFLGTVKAGKEEGDRKSGAKTTDSKVAPNRD